MTMNRRVFTRSAVVAFTLALVWSVVTSGQDPGPIETDETDETDWIHEDIEAGYAEALATGKPLLVAFR